MSNQPINVIALPQIERGTYEDYRQPGNRYQRDLRRALADWKREYDDRLAYLLALSRSTPIQFAPSDPTGTTSTTGVMMGLSSGTTRITPVASGRVLVTVTGTGLNNTANDGVAVQLRYGTGNGPANGAALTGTTVGSYKSLIPPSLFTLARVGFACSGLITGLTIGTAIYLDVAVKAITGGTASVYDIDIVAHEF